MKELNVNYGMVKETKKDGYSAGYCIYCMVSVVPIVLMISFISIALTETLAAIHNVAEYGCYSLECYRESVKWFLAGIGILLIVLLIAVALFGWLAYCLVESDTYFGVDEVQCEQCVHGSCCGKERCKEEALKAKLALYIIATIIATVFLCACFGSCINYLLLEGLFSSLFYSIGGALLGALSSGAIMAITKRLCSKKN